MSCTKSDAPINISKSNEVFNCNGKCNLRYNYKASNISAYNKKNYIEINLANKTETVINYSTNTRSSKCQAQGGEFLIDHARIYHPSMHTFNGKRTDAELVILHKNTSGADDLLLCIPITTTSGTQPSASRDLTSIIQYLQKVGNSEGEGGIIPSLNLNFNNFIPKKSFYTYSGSLPFIPCTECVIFIVYDVNEASINLSPETLSIFKEFINSKYFLIKPFTRDLGLAYNSEGATLNNGSLGNDIWIDCQPTGSEGQVLIDETPNNLSTSNIPFIDRFKELITGGYLGYVLGFILVIIVFYIISKILKKLEFFSGGAPDVDN